MPTLLQDIRFTLRQLRKNPGFAFTTILTLALGIGATTGIFSLVNSVLLRPLPFPQSDRLTAMLHEDNTAGANPTSVSYPDFFDWRTQNHSFSAMASYRDQQYTLSNVGDAQNLQGITVSSEFFRVLSIHPMLGRDFIPGDEKAGQHVVMLSYQLWQSAFGSRRDIAGQTITLDGRGYTVAGVMPQGFAFPIQNPAPQLWATLATDALDGSGEPGATQSRGENMLTIVGRLKPGVTVEQARAEMSLIDRNLAAQYPDTNKRYTSTHVQPMLESLVGDTRPALHILFAAVALLLLIACANVAGLLLARSSRRRGEIALRAALGASRNEILRQILVESLLLSFLGGALGLAFSTLFLKATLRFLPHNLPRLDTISVDTTVLGFAVLASVLTGLIFGVFPAWSMSKLDPALVLRDGTRSVTSGRGQHSLHNTLVIVETALGLLLLVGSGLFIRSFVHVLSVDPGFDRRNVLTASVNYPDTKEYATKVVQLYDQFLPKLATLPGVTSVAAGWPLPFSDSQIGVSFTAEGHPTATGDEPVARLTIATPNFFNTLRIPILRGRDFTATDSGTSPYVVIVSEGFARKYFPGEDVIGKHITPGLDDGIHKKGPREIIAVVGDIKLRSLTKEAPPMFYLPLTQSGITAPSLAIRTAGDPVAIIPAVRAQLNSINRNIPIYHVAALGDLLSDASSQPRFQMLLLTSFAVMALLLSAVGLYAVLAYMVAQRTSELGLRMALGAQRGDVLALILKKGLRLAGIGLVAGLAASALLTRFVASQLYGVKVFDPITYIGVSILLLAIAFLASAAPALQASRVDPMKTLRDQ
ncbi:putative permease [Silvibacterium bohemicum]|uniref:Putative permease n=1 Tax=Silvibacterium bohemicum TaxID=1577686 RepID=A0A841JPN2_9BACT|nr:ABC transporter permease [Silvibacterium bohemicum]MBB6143306.1 putative permease [Silvibacterium bohemicum]